MAADHFFVGDVDNDYNDPGNWSATSGGAGGFGIPVSTDRARFDGNSPNCTIDIALNPTVGQIFVEGSYTNTFDVNDNNLTIDGNDAVVIAGGTVDMGNAQWLLNFSSSTTAWVFTGGIVNAEGSEVKYTGHNKTINAGSMIFNDIDIALPTNRNYVITGTQFVGGNLLHTSTAGINVGILDLKGDYKSVATSGGGTGVVKLTGSSTQDIFTDKAGGNAVFASLQFESSADINLFDTIKTQRNTSGNVIKFNSGTVNEGTSKIQIIGSNSVSIDTGIVEFNDFEVSLSTNRSLTVTGATIIKGLTTFINTSGILTGTLDCRGNVISTSGSMLSSAILKLSGVNQTISAGGGDGRFPRINIASSGTTTFVDTIRAMVSGSVEGWLYTSGTVDVTAAKIIFDNDTSQTFTVNDPTTNFNDVEFSTRNTNGNLVITTNIKIDGDLSIVSGSNIQGLVDLKGNCISTTVSTTFNMIISMIGTTPQEIFVDKASGSGFFPGFNFNSSGGVTLFDDIRFRRGSAGDLIKFTSGTVDTATAHTIFDKSTTGACNVDSVNVKWNDAEINCSHASGDITIVGTLFVVDFKMTAIDTLNTGILDISGNSIWIDSGTGGTASTNMSGGNEQTIDMNGGTGRMPNGPLTIDKTNSFARLINGDLNLDASGQDMIITDGSFFCTNENDLIVNDVITNDGTLQKITGDTVTPAPVGNAVLEVVVCRGPQAGVSLLNSVVCGDGQATLNVTPPVSANYNFTRVFYRKRDESSWTVGDSFVGTQGVAGDFIQTGLTNGFIYDFVVFTADTNGGNSPPSAELWCRVQTTGPVSEEKLWLDNLEIIIANSEKFQDVIGATGTTGEKIAAAKLRIHRAIKPTVTKPYIVIDFQDGADNTKISESGHLGEALLYMAFVQDSTLGGRDNAEEDFDTFINNTGIIRAELLILSGTDNFLNIRNIGFGEFNPTFLADEEQADEIIVAYSIESGI